MRIGLLVARSGPAGIWAPACDAGATFAAAGINMHGGVLGRPVELVIADAGWTSSQAVEAANQLVAFDHVDGVVGMHASNLREPVRRTLGGRAPYVFTPQFEGGARAPFIAATGGLDEELLGPSIDWLVRNRRARRFYLVGSDYVWPRTAHRQADAIIRSAGAHLVGEEIVPFGNSGDGERMERIRRARPDVVVVSLLGYESVVFNRLFAETGLSSRSLRLGLALDETILYAVGAEASEGLYSTLTYFGGLRTRANQRYLEDYHTAFEGEGPPVTVFSQSCFEGVHYLSSLARSEGEWRGLALARALRRSPPRGAVRGRLAELPMGERLTAYLAEADGLDFRLLC